MDEADQHDVHGEIVDDRYETLSPDVRKVQLLVTRRHGDAELNPAPPFRISKALPGSTDMLSAR